jgi:hypothetical protein
MAEFYVVGAHPWAASALFSAVPPGPPPLPHAFSPEETTRMLLDHDAAIRGIREELAVGGTRNRAFAFPEDGEQLCEGCRRRNLRGSRLHFHLLGITFWQIPFVAAKAISTNPTQHRAA